MKSIIQQIKGIALNYKPLPAFLLFLFLLSACQLDYENTESIPPDGIWEDEKMIYAYLTDIYYGLMPGWRFTSDGSDESASQNTSMSDYERGNNVTVSNFGRNFDYQYIDKINFLLEQLPNVDERYLSKKKNDQITGQAHFWRAWRYWSYVKELGGIPLILKSQNVFDFESLFVERSSTSECISSILADLDKAISLLPDNWSGTDYGRIDRCAALALKGRILLWYTSPLFNRGNDQTRWKKAYDANKEAYDVCLAAGRALYPDYSQIWQKKGPDNTEAIMFMTYSYPNKAYNMNEVLPEPLTSGNASRCLPMLPQILAFPLKDGSSIALFPKSTEFNLNGLDLNRLENDPAYNAEIAKKLVLDMDSRFYATMGVPGTEFPSLAVPGGENYWSAYRKDLGETGNYIYTCMTVEQFHFMGISRFGGFFPLKAVTPGSDKITSERIGENNYLEIRMSEVYLNLAECAAQLDKPGEALGYIAAVRARAGIERGTGSIGYGLDLYNSKAGVLYLLINERLAEFAQEFKRFDDLRRWMRFDIPNDEKFRSTLHFVINNPDNVANFDWKENMKNDETRAKFHLEYIENVTGISQNQYNFTTMHWFYPIGLNTMTKNFMDNLAQQNNEWGGTFDPLN